MKYKIVKNLIFFIVGILLIVASIMPKGSFSFFNDVEALPGTTLAVGTCDLSAKPNDKDIFLTSKADMIFSLMQNSTPGNKGRKSIHIHNKGTLPIEHLYLDARLDNKKWDLQNAIEFAEQFKVYISLEKNGDKKYVGTVAQLLANTEDGESFDVAELFPNDELADDKKETIIVDIEFVDLNHQRQKKHEGNQLKIKLFFEANC